MRIFLKCVGAVLVGASSLSYGVSVKTTYEGHTLDWAASRLMLEGSAGSEEVGTVKSFSEIEKEAWANGLESIRKVSEGAYVAHYEKQGGNVADEAHKVGLRAARGVYSQNTEYVSDGTVKIHLESRLSNVLSPVKISHAVEVKPDYENLLKETTGVVFKLACQIPPRADFKVYDDDGDLVYAPEMISKEAYAQVLSGRWYRKPLKWEIKFAAGPSPKEIEVACLDGGKFEIDEDEWEAVSDADRRVIVEAARVAIVVP